MDMEQNKGLSKVQKFFLVLVFLWLLFPLLGGLLENSFLLVAVSIALMAAVICLFIKKLDAKHAWTVFAVSIILPFIMIAILIEPKDESGSKQRVEKAEKSKEDLSNKKKKTKEPTEKVEKKRQEPQMSAKEREVADAGAKQGLMFGMAGAGNEEFSNMLDLADYVDGMDDQVKRVFEEMAGNEYDKQYGSPSNAEEKKLKTIYIKHFIEAMNNTMDGMDELEKLGGKRK